MALQLFGLRSCAAAGEWVLSSKPHAVALSLALCKAVHCHRSWCVGDILCHAMCLQPRTCATSASVPAR